MDWRKSISKVCFKVNGFWGILAPGYFSFQYFFNSSPNEKTIFLQIVENWILVTFELSHLLSLNLIHMAFEGLAGFLPDLLSRYADPTFHLETDPRNKYGFGVDHFCFWTII